MPSPEPPCPPRPHLALLAMVPFVAAAWAIAGPDEALFLPAMGVWFFCRQWVEMRVHMEVRWKEDRDG